MRKMPWHVSVTDVNLWNVKDPPKDEAVPTNAAFCKQIIISGIPMVFRWFSSSSLTVPKGPTTIGITVALTSHNLWTCNLKSGIWWFFLAPSLRCFDLQEQLCRWFCILSSLYQWLQYLVFGDLFLYLFGLQSPKAFYICHFPPLVLVDARTICLHIQSQISCIRASVLFSNFVGLFQYWFPARTEHELAKWVPHSTFTFQSLESRDTSWWSIPFF